MSADLMWPAAVPVIEVVIEDAPTRRCVPGQPSPGRVPNTLMSEGDPMVTARNLDCVALGCDWVWWDEICTREHTHTVRVCARCLTPDPDSEPCRQEVAA